ncbi:hypothetical protein JCM19233_1465 [Vibrio astriarenae]|nr:hypothetical protein JCM19233_1465 [Vibrio sp. C7]
MGFSGLENSLVGCVKGIDVNREEYGEYSHTSNLMCEYTNEFSE